MGQGVEMLPITFTAGSRGDSKNRNNNKIKDDPSTPKGEDPIPGELAAEYRSQLMPNMKKLYAICFPKRNLTREVSMQWWVNCFEC